MKKLPRPKTVKLSCFSGGPDLISENWEDVWLSYRVNRHQRMYLGPCFESEQSIRESLAYQQQYWAPIDCREPHIAHEGMAEYQVILAGIANGYVYEPRPHDCSNVCIPGGKLTRQSVEAAVRWLLATHHGLTNVKLKWQR